MRDGAGDPRDFLFLLERATYSVRTSQSDLSRDFVLKGPACKLRFLPVPKILNDGTDLTQRPSPALLGLPVVTTWTQAWGSKPQRKQLLNFMDGASWWAQSVERVTPDVGVVSSSPTVGLEMT